MSATILNDVNAQIQKFWAPMFVSELKESALIPNLVNTTYSSDIKALGNAATVSMIEAATGSTKTIDSSGGHTVIDSEKLVSQNVQVVADKIFSASFELDSLIDLQSQLGSPDGQSKIRAALLKGIELQINDFVYSLAVPSTSAPDHDISSISDFNFAQLQAVRALASKAKWSRAEGPWNLLLNPDYMNDFMNDQKNSSSDYVGSDLPLVGGQRPYFRSGFQILEDNSDAMSRLSPTSVSTDLGLAFHKDFLYLVMQTMPTFKLSDLHANKQRGYLLTCDLVGGAKLGIQGNKKVIKIYNA
jgi:hypothetical protein